MKLPKQLTLLTKERHRSPFKPGLTLDYQVGEKYARSGFTLGKMHGPYVVWHADGVTKGMEGRHVNGKQEGLWTSRHKNGNISMELPFKGGEIDGKMRRFYTDGGKRWEIEFKNGVKEGVEIKWYENGVKSSEYHYRGELLMFAKGWKPNGDAGRTSVVDGDGIITTYYSIGDNFFRDWEYSYKNGRRDGTQVRYNEDGSEKARIMYNEGELVIQQKDDERFSNNSKLLNMELSDVKKYYDMTALITNLGGPNKSRYITLKLKLEGQVNKFMEILELHDHQIRDKALYIMGSYTYEDAKLEGFQERVREDLKKGFSHILRKYKYEDSDLIKQIYFTQFVIQ
jgi:antitoxin component YwqK of YwqJK toxin-antitoxin module